MREVIQGLIEAEGEAKQLVESARQEADRLVAEAQRRAQGLLAQARTEARVQAEKKRCLEKAELETREAAQLDAATRDQIVRAVVDAVCRSPLSSPGEGREHGTAAPAR